MDSAKPRVPVAARRPCVRRAHGECRQDPYAWLENIGDPDVIDHLRAENAYSEAMLEADRPLQETLFREFRSRLNEDDMSVPVADGGWLYYTRTRAGLEYPIYCRRAERPGAPEQTVLDVNRLAEGVDYYDLGALEVGPDHRRVLYAEDVHGNECYRLRVFDLDSREVVDEVIDGIDDAIWMQDGKRLLYTRMDDSRRPCEVWLHAIGDPTNEDVCLLREPDPAFFVHLDRTLDRRYLLITAASHVTSEVHVVDAGAPRPCPAVFWSRVPGVEYALEHRQGEFFVLTNHLAPNFRLLRAPGGPAHCREWEQMLAHDPAVRLEGMDVFSRHLVLYTREQGLARARACDLRSGEWHEVALGEDSLVCIGPGDNPVFEREHVRLVVTAYTEPARVYDYDLNTREAVLRKQVEISGGIDTSRYVARRIHATAPDGTAVPVSLVHRRDLDLDRGMPAPCLLTGYGAYGACLEPSFSPARLSLLDRGFVYAEAHVRGGGELGEQWRDAGRLGVKTNTFDDFIAVAEHLCSLGLTSPRCLGLTGASAGGLLLGAVLNRRAELFAAAVAEVPFVDVLNTMLDPALPLTVIEYDEWGDPRREADYRRIRDYSPYEQVCARSYPALLVLAGLNDSRVPYWEAAKWVARLRGRQTGREPVLLKVEMGNGHAGPSGRYQAMRELALQYAFLIDRLCAHASEAAGESPECSASPGR